MLQAGAWRRASGRARERTVGRRALRRRAGSHTRWCRVRSSVPPAPPRRHVQCGLRAPHTPQAPVDEGNVQRAPNSSSARGCGRFGSSRRHKRAQLTELRPFVFMREKGQNYKNKFVNLQSCLAAAVISRPTRAPIMRGAGPRLFNSHRTLVTRARAAPGRESSREDGSAADSHEELLNGRLEACRREEHPT